VKICILGTSDVAELLRDYVFRTDGYVLVREGRAAFTLDVRATAAPKVRVDTPDGPLERQLLAALREQAQFAPGIGRIELDAEGGNQNPRVLVIEVPTSFNETQHRYVATAIYHALLKATGHGRPRSWWRTFFSLAGIIFILASPAYAQRVAQGQQGSQQSPWFVTCVNPSTGNLESCGGSGGSGGGGIVDQGLGGANPWLVKFDGTGANNDVDAIQSGVWTVRLFDGSGNSLSSTSGALNANITNASIAVTGTFWQATQPVSVASTLAVDQVNTLETDYDTGAGTVNQSIIGLALPGSGGPVIAGTATNPIRIDPTGTTTQPVSGTVTANISGSISNTGFNVNNFPTTASTSAVSVRCVNAAGNAFESCAGAGGSGGGGDGAINDGVTAATKATVVDKITGGGTVNPLVITGASTLGVETPLATESTLGTVEADLALLGAVVGSNAAAHTAQGYTVLGSDGTNGRRLKTDTSGELQVDVLTMPTTTVTGTVTANAGTGTFTVDTEADVTTSAPGASANGLVVRNIPSGTQSVNVAQLNGTTTSTGNGVSGTGVIRVTIASDSTGQVTANQGTSPWITKNQRAATSNVASVSASATSTTCLASNANRLNATVYNDSSADLYLKLGATASTSSFTLKIAGGGYYELPVGNIYTGVIDCIWSSATGAARVTEMTP